MVKKFNFKGKDELSVSVIPTFHPQFIFFCNLPQYIKDPYKRFLENKLREGFDFSGCPIQIFFRTYIDPNTPFLK